MLTPATIGILATSAGADRFARRHPQRWLVIAVLIPRQSTEATQQADPSPAAAR